VAKTKPKRKPKPPKYHWFWLTEGKEIACFQDERNTCIVTKLWEPELSDFHDAELQHATKQINEILDRVARANPDPSRDLHFINVQGRLMLVWARHADVVTDDSDEDEILNELKIRPFNERE
jgi:hypothetical protein